MKFNLKNRPKSEVAGILPSKTEIWLYQTSKVDEWFEGFENELRDELAKIEIRLKGWDKNNLHGEWWNIAYRDGYFNIKEILGE